MDFTKAATDEAASRAERREARRTTSVKPRVVCERRLRVWLMRHARGQLSQALLAKSKRMDGRGYPEPDAGLARWLARQDDLAWLDGRATLEEKR